MARYLIGIDLGTTNSALAYIDLTASRSRTGTPEIHKFAVPQLIAAGEIGMRPLLPSFLYLPGPHDLPAGAAALPWDANAAAIAGEFARNHGARIPGRLVTSAKSWLCHAGVDRSAPLLPWSAPPDVPRISPVEASTRYLRHFVDGWNHAHGQGRWRMRLENQTVVLTVPASFDDMARTLTVEAARKAGLENLTLLEEPQAAFYCWLATHPPKEAAAAEARLSLPGRRRRRRHQRLQPDPGRRAAGRTGLRPPGGRRSSAAGRRQHGPGPGQIRRDQAARRRPARRRPVRHADPGVPPGQGKSARAGPACRIRSR